MAVRESINKRPKLVAAVIGGILAVAAGFLVLNFGSSGGSSGLTDAVYFTSDDGANWFAASPDNTPPFEQGGKTAVRVYVFRCGKQGKPFAGYLERIAPEARDNVVALKAKADKRYGSQALIDALGKSTQVKRPGDPNWHYSNSGEGFAAQTLKCPDGETGVIEPIYP